MPEALDGPSVCHDPVFILTGSRSGSTLLRFILDTHPDFACPPETMITGACVSLLRSWDILENAGSGQQRLVTEPAQLPAAALDTVRDTVDRLYGRYLARRGKPRWCDKSLDSQFNAELLAAMYPQARFVCLYRHCMDVIASGIEVCPWGVSRFGFDAYVAQNPGNNVAAIGSYWADCARVILAFEESQPERCFRVRYEDLVTAPEEVTAGLLHFLGATPAPGITAACFGVPHEGDGPGDEKIWFTSSVSADAIGRGVKVPAAALPYAVRGQINETLIKLGYRTIDDDWNDAPGAVAGHPPRHARVKLQGCVSGLRKALGGSGSSDGSARWSLVTREPGYLISPAGVTVDLLEYRALLRLAAGELDAGQVTVAAGHLGEALALWRGTAYADVRTPVLCGMADALERGRLLAVERKADCDLQLGRHAEVAEELTAILAIHPFREGARAALMLALYRCGCRAEALECYRIGRHQLREQLGIEPGQLLRQLHERMLADDPQLAVRGPLARFSETAPASYFDLKKPAR